MAQIIIPGAQVGRKNDIFVCSVGAAHSVATRGVYVAIISAKLEARKPEEDTEVKEDKKAKPSA